MDRYVTGTTIKELREKNGMSQAQLAQMLCVTDKAISKWETGAGYPDITLLEPLAAALRVSVAELISGSTVVNENVSANMLKSHFYVCPLCGNTVHSMGQAHISCHGITLPALSAEPIDENHRIHATSEGDELCVTVDHVMSKNHHLVFLAALSPNSLQMLRLYPEGASLAHFKRSGVTNLYAYCNKDGLYTVSLSDALGA